jgi:hypothetical protein
MNMSALLQAPGIVVEDGRPVPVNKRATLAQPVRPRVAIPWIRVQSTNVNRHAAYLRPFHRDEFGSGNSSPSPGHVQATNQLIKSLRAKLFKLTRKVTAASNKAAAQPTTAHLQDLVERKERAHAAVRSIEKVWDYYFLIFSQRQTRFGEWMVACDRIALDCYQDTFMGLGVAKSIPAPPPFAHMEVGRTPATFRRGIRLSRLGQINPFPLVQLPYHRLLNPWTLGAITHEVCHNFQNELGLAKLIPRNIAATLLKAGLGRSVAAVWTRWNRETYADLHGLLLGGPAIVGSLLDVVGRSPSTVLTYNSRGVHPTPYLRVFLSLELLRRMGFTDEAEQYRKLWQRVYPDPRSGTIPNAVLETYPEAIRLIVDTVCFRRYQTLGNKSLAEVVPFGPKEQQVTEEASRRLAAGIDPGIIPERFLIGAARLAVDRRLARPEVITKNFYRDLARR